MAKRESFQSVPEQAPRTDSDNVTKEPPKTKADLNKILESEWENYLSTLGQNSLRSRQEFKHLLEVLKPDIDDSVSSGDARSLNYLNVRMKNRIEESGSSVLQNNQLTAMAIIHAVLATRLG